MDPHQDEAAAHAFLALHSATLAQHEEMEAVGTPRWPIVPQQEPQWHLARSCRHPASLIVLLADLSEDEYVPFTALRVGTTHMIWPRLASFTEADLLAAAELGDYWQLPVPLIDRVRQELAALKGISDEVPAALESLIRADAQRFYNHALTLKIAALTLKIAVGHVLGELQGAFELQRDAITIRWVPTQLCIRGMMALSIPTGSEGDQEIQKARREYLFSAALVGRDCSAIPGVNAREMCEAQCALASKWGIRSMKM